MKIRFILIIGIIFLFCLCGCNDKQNAPKKQSAEIVGFEVNEQATVEAGTNYTFETPEVTCNGKPVTLSVVVKKGSTLIAHDNVKVYLESEGEYSIEYFASVGSESQSKITKLIACDTSLPVIVTKLPSSVRFGYSLVVKDYIIGKDVSGVKSTEYKAKGVDGSGKEIELSNAEYDERTTELKIDDEKIRKVIITAKVIDNNDFSSEKNFEIKMVEKNKYGYYDFSNYENFATKVDGVVAGYNNADGSYGIVEEDGKKALKFTVTTKSINNYVNVILDNEIFGDFSSFDAVNFEMKLNCTGNGGNVGVGGEWTTFEGPENVFADRKNEYKTLRLSNKSSLNSIKEKKAISLIFKPWAAQTVEIYIRSISASFENILVNSSTDLLKTFGVEELEISATYTPNGMQPQSVSNLSNATFDQKGVLTVEINKNGYTPNQFVINVKDCSQYGVVNFGNVDSITNISAFCGFTEFDVDFIQDGDYQAVKTTITGQYPKLSVKTDALKFANDFDYLTVRYKLSYSASGGSVGIQGLVGNIYNGATSTAEDDGWIVGVWRKDANTVGADVFYYITNNGEFILSLDAWNGNSTQTTITIAEIKFGYDDLQVGNSAVDVLEKLCLNESEAVGTFNGVEVENLREFKPSEDGILNVVITKNGFKQTTIKVNVTIRT